MAEEVEIRTGPAVAFSPTLGPVVPLTVWVGTFAFPAEGWTDNGAIALGWWCRSLAALLMRMSRQETLRFMEGPYFLDVSVLSPQEIAVRFQQDRRHGMTTAHAVTVSLAPFAAAVVSAAASVREVCGVVGFAGRDFEELDAAIGMLRRVSRS